MDDDDELLFDSDLDGDELPDEASAWANKLVVNAPAETSEALNLAEESYRAHGRRPVPFIDEDANGFEYLSNAPEFAKLMGLDSATPVTIEQADEFQARFTAPDGTWLYWVRR
jgi:hypothetical protein